MEQFLNGTNSKKNGRKAGVDVDKLLNLLVKNASAELTTYYITQS